MFVFNKFFFGLNKIIDIIRGICIYLCFYDVYMNIVFFLLYKRVKCF